MTEYEWFVSLMLLGNMIMGYLVFQKTERSKKDIEELKKELGLAREKEGYLYKKQYEFAEELTKWMDRGIKIITDLSVYKKGLEIREETISGIKEGKDISNNDVGEEDGKFIIEMAEKQIREIKEEKIPRAKLEYDDWALSQIYYLSKVMMIKRLKETDVKENLKKFYEILSKKSMEDIEDVDEYLREMGELGRLYFSVNAEIREKLEL